MSTVARSVPARNSVDYAVRQQRIQYADMIISMLVFSALFAEFVLIAAWLLSPETTQLLAFAIILAPLMLTTLMYPMFRRENRQLTGFSFFLLTLGFVISTSGFVFPGAIPALAISFVVMYMLVNFMLGDHIARWVLVWGALNMGAYMLLAKPISESLFEPLEATLELVLSILLAILSVLTSSLVLRYIVVMQSRQLEEAQQARFELEQRANVIDMQRVQLELSNAEIEAQGEAEQAQRAQLEALVSKVQMLIGNLRVTTAEIEAEAREQMARATQQDTAVTETATTVDEVISTVRQVADRAEAVAQTAQQTVTVSQEGQSAVADSIQGMARIEDRVEKIAQAIATLSSSTKQISETINSVSEIADQSKLLAINAAIEAARAGEDARGFNIVAMEVRQLADQSQEAAHRVNTILLEIETATKAAIQATADGRQETEAGRKLADTVGTVIRELAASLETASTAAQQIAASTQQQTNAMDQLAAATNEIKQTSQQNADGARQIARSIGDLGQLSRELEDAARSD